MQGCISALHTRILFAIIKMITVENKGGDIHEKTAGMVFPVGLFGYQ